MPSIPWRSLLALIGILPQSAVSRGFGTLAAVPIPRPLRRPVLGGFARTVGADLSEVARDLDEFGSLDEFFVRRLRPGARTWPGDDAVAASPVDGIVGEVGSIRDGEILQAKGRWYSVAELLDDTAEAEWFEGGLFVTIYLSPRHYHRIHTPCRGRIPKARYVPGALLPVNPPAVFHLPKLFARNERLICYLDGPLGRVAVVAVGALNVGRISAAFDPRWGGDARGVTNRPRAISTRDPARAEDAAAPGETRLYDPPVRVRQGDEVMAFHLGSTVVLLFEPGLSLDTGLEPGEEIRLGAALATRLAAVSPPRPPPARVEIGSASAYTGSPETTP